MSSAGMRLIYAARLAHAQVNAEVFVRDVLVNVFKQSTTDEQVRDIARKIVRNFSPETLRDPPAPILSDRRG